MRGGGVKIGRILGIPIYLHTSWFLIFALVTFSFYAAFGLPLALLTSALFFGSVLFHELSHSVVAIHYRIPVVSITLFFLAASRGYRASRTVPCRNFRSPSPDQFPATYLPHFLRC